MRFISQLIKGISRVLLIKLKYFNNTAIWTFFVLPSGRFFLVTLILDLSGSEFIMRVDGSSL